MAVYSTHYSILLPVDTVFNSIDDLANLAGHANSPLTPQQIIGLAYVILAKEPILQQDFCLWNRKPMADRTFAQHARSFLQSPAQPNSLPNAGNIFHQQPDHHANSVITMADLVAQRLLDAMPTADEPHVADAPTGCCQCCRLQRKASIAALHT